MAKQSGMLKRQKEEQKTRDRVVQDATRQTFVQYMTDTLLYTLNDPEIMGKDVFGYARLKKILDAWGAKYDLYFDALRRIVPEGEPFFTFEERYQWLPLITYGEAGKKKGGGKR